MLFGFCMELIGFNWTGNFLCGGVERCIYSGVSSPLLLSLLSLSLLLITAIAVIVALAVRSILLLLLPHRNANASCPLLRQ